MGPDSYKALDTSALILANRNAVRAKQNRTLSSAFLDRLDDDGMHIVAWSMFHTNYEGTDGVRAHLLCKLKDTDKPMKVWLDFVPADFNALGSVKNPAAQV